MIYREANTVGGYLFVHRIFSWCAKGIVVCFYHVGGIHLTEVISVIFEYRVKIQPV